MNIPARSGITPAWAGKSYHARYMVIIIRDHPRVGGEKMKKWANDIELEGSPPRGRGKGRGRTRMSVLVGITPAWAGKSYAEAVKQLGFRDHPRVGGEK